MTGAAGVTAQALGPARAGGPVVRFERRAMGSSLRLVVVGASDADADAAWSRVQAEIEAAEQAMSRFRESSDATRANRAAGDGTWIEVDQRLRRALVAADRAARLTCGRFEARVLADLERLGYVGVPQAPAASEGRSILEPGERWLAVDGRAPRVALGAPVDLGGIGKGLAVRWAWRELRRGLRPGTGAMLEAGGDLIVGGPSPDAGPWSVGIEDPRADGEHVAVIAVEDGAIATSSVVVNRWQAPDGRLVHHLIDPTTGEPGGRGLLSVTVALADPAWAEVWSKTLFLAGRRRIAETARGRGLAAWWVTSDGQLEMTPAARQMTAWEASPPSRRA